MQRKQKNKDMNTKLNGWVAVNMNGKECFFNTIYPPYRESFQRDPRFPKTFWATDSVFDMLALHYGTIEKWIGRELTWEDEPVWVEIDEK